MATSKYGPMTAQVGRNLRYWRQQRGMKLAELAERLGELGLSLGITGLSKVENGNRGVDIDDLIALARALEIPPLQLLFPIGLDRTVELLPGMQAPTWEAARWFAGESGFLTHIDGDEWGVTHEDNLSMENSALSDFRAQDAAIEEWRESKRRAERARDAAAATDDPQERDRQLRLAQADDDGRERITERSLRMIREHIRGWGLDPLGLPAELAHVDGAGDGER